MFGPVLWLLLFSCVNGTGGTHEHGGCKDDHFYTYLNNGEVNCQFDPTDGHRGLCSYYCHRGYEIHGQHVVNYHLDLGWNGEKPNCHPIRCPKFDVMNGDVNCSHFNFFKSQCRVVCHRGFELSIPNITTITCGEERQWSEAIPKCISKVCLKSYTILLHGHVQCDGKLKNEYGSVCYYTCNQGFQLIGKDEIKCIENRDGVVEWTKPVKPICRNLSIECPKSYMEMLNGNVECTRENGNNNYETRCNYSCFPGYILNGTEILTCDYDGLWSDEKPVCLDNEPPSFNAGCRDLHVTAEKFGQPTTVIYDVPVATDNSGSDHVIIKGTPPPNSVFPIGKTDVNVTATDSAGNMGLCVFSVTVEPASCGEPNIDTTNKQLIKYTCRNNYVYGDTCTLACSDGNPIVGPNVITCTKVDNSDEYKWTAKGISKPTCNPQRCAKLEPPRNGMVVCSTTGAEIQICSVLCENYYTPPLNYRHIYTCSNSSGTWSPSTKIVRCIRARKLSGSRFQPSFYYKNTQCSKDNEEIKAKFLETISNDVLLKYLCENGCRITNITVECYNNTSNRKKRDTLNGFYKITTTIALGTLPETRTALESRNYFQHLENKINERIMSKFKSGIFNIPEIGDLDTVDFAKVQFVCNLGESVVLETMSCAGCGAGFFYNNITQACSVCPHGSYQEQDVSFSCNSCPYPTTTRTEAATSLTECQDLCTSGESSATGTKPCRPCAAGTYQPGIGSERCIRCPFGMTTSSNGQTSSAACYFNNVQLTEESAPIIQIYNSDPQEFTFMTWIYNYRFVFGEAYEDLASIVIDTISLYLEQPRNSLTAKSRKWNHIALVYDRGNITLYENGRSFESIKANISLLANKAIRFLQSSACKEIIVHGFQLTTKALTEAEIQSFSMSCVKQMERHFLSEDPFNKLKLTPSTCNAGCGAGFSYNNVTNTCSPCTYGTYQDQDISFSCKDCPSGKTTKKEGATSIQECQEN